MSESVKLRKMKSVGRSKKKARLEQIRKEHEHRRKSINNVCNKIGSRTEYCSIERMMNDLGSQDDELRRVSFKSGVSWDCTSTMKNLMKVESELRNPQEEDDQGFGEQLYSNVVFMDDVHGGELDWHKVIKARMLEIEYFRKMGVWERVLRSEAKDQAIKSLAPDGLIRIKAIRSTPITDLAL